MCVTVLYTSLLNSLAYPTDPSRPHPPSSHPLLKDAKSLYGSTQPQPFPNAFAGPSMPPTTVYHYTNPNTRQHVTSLLPPDHPEMICLQAGVHVPETKFGILGALSLSCPALGRCVEHSVTGILAAVIWFPFGIGLCLLDRKVRCQRCGLILDDGVCG
jgi:hypothetical protein